MPLNNTIINDLRAAQNESWRGEIISLGADNVLTRSSPAIVASYHFQFGRYVEGEMLGYGSGIRSATSQKYVHLTKKEGSILSPMLYATCRLILARCYRPPSTFFGPPEENSPLDFARRKKKEEEEKRRTKGNAGRTQQVVEEETPPLNQGIGSVSPTESDVHKLRGFHLYGPWAGQIKQKKKK